MGNANKRMPTMEKENKKWKIGLQKKNVNKIFGETRRMKIPPIQQHHTNI